MSSAGTIPLTMYSQTTGGAKRKVSRPYGERAVVKRTFSKPNLLASAEDAGGGGAGLGGCCVAGGWGPKGHIVLAIRWGEAIW